MHFLLQYFWYIFYINRSFLNCLHVKWITVHSESNGMKSILISHFINWIKCLLWNSVLVLLKLNSKAFFFFSPMVSVYNAHSEYCRVSLQMPLYINWKKYRALAVNNMTRRHVACPLSFSNILWMWPVHRRLICQTKQTTHIVNIS